MDSGTDPIEDDELLYRRVPASTGWYDPAHAELPGLNSESRKANQTLERQRILADKLSLRVEGPFETCGGEST